VLHYRLVYQYHNFNIYTLYYKYISLLLQDCFRLTLMCYYNVLLIIKKSYNATMSFLLRHLSLLAFSLQWMMSFNFKSIFVHLGLDNPP
jgi:hypothetical protein